MVHSSAVVVLLLSSAQQDVFHEQGHCLVGDILVFDGISHKSPLFLLDCTRSG